MGTIDDLGDDWHIPELWRCPRCWCLFERDGEKVVCPKCGKAIVDDEQLPGRGNGC